MTEDENYRRGYFDGHSKADRVREDQVKSMVASQDSLRRTIQNYQRKVSEIEAGYDPAQVFEWEFRFTVALSQTDWNRKQGRFRAIAHNFHNSEGRIGWGETKLKAVYDLFNSIAERPGGFEQFKLVGLVDGATIEMRYTRIDQSPNISE